MKKTEWRSPNGETYTATEVCQYMEEALLLPDGRYTNAAFVNAMAGVISGRVAAESPREDLVVLSTHEGDHIELSLELYHLMQFKRHYLFELICACSGPRGLTWEQKATVGKLFNKQFERLEAILVDRISHEEEVRRFCQTKKTA